MTSCKFCINNIIVFPFWFQIHRVSLSGKPPRFLMKGDDDTYYNIPLIHETILQNKEWYNFALVDFKISSGSLTLPRPTQNPF